MRWLIQIPRLYSVYKEVGGIESFQDFIYNIFKPLFDVTKDPSVDPTLHKFLYSVSTDLLYLLQAHNKMH